MISIHMVMLTALAIPITLGQSIVDLNGSWRFHTGDDASWADPNFDDSTWESVDLTPPPGAHDGDVGLTGYVPGWGARGHRGYSGYAWYRMRVSISGADKEPLALCGPTAVDSTYQVFVNGRLLGGSGQYSIQPRVFALPRSLNPTLIAFRVWMGSPDPADAAAGGIHIAPALGAASSIDVRYQMQWLQTIRGYIVEVVEAAVFFLLASMAAVLGWHYRWLCAGLAFIGLYRANQAIFYWGQFETANTAEFVSIVLLLPLCLAAWTLAWRDWFHLRDVEWMRIAVGVATLLYIGAQFLAGSWFHGVFPASAILIAATRICFLVLTVFIAYRALRQHGPASGLALLGMLLVSIGLFARELSSLGVRGIWFPYGTGVSRTQFAYAAFHVVLYAVLLRRFRSFARNCSRASHFGFPSEDLHGFQLD